MVKFSRYNGYYFATDLTPMLASLVSPNPLAFWSQPLIYSPNKLARAPLVLEIRLFLRQLIQQEDGLVA